MQVIDGLDRTGLEQHQVGVLARGDAAHNVGGVHGLGAIEVATIAGLTGIGVSSGAAVYAVIIYRLATYWLPVLPGWLSWRLLQRMEYV